MWYWVSKEREKRRREQILLYTSPLQYEKSFANSHEAILLRRVLQDEGSREPFQRYLCIKASPGTHPREDIQFWLEVQRYKVEPPHSCAYLINFSWSRITWLYIIIGLLHVCFISVSLKLSSTKPILKVTVSQPTISVVTYMSPVGLQPGSRFLISEKVCLIVPFWVLDCLIFNGSKVKL